MNQFDVFETFGKKITGMFRVNQNKTELLLDDGSKVVWKLSIYDEGFSNRDAQ